MDQPKAAPDAGEPQMTSATTHLREFVALLLRRYEILRAREALPVQEAAAEQHLASLQLAEAALRYADAAAPPRPAQIAVLGPTQTGKSTVVNLVLGRRVAQASPLAGFTVHAHGYVLGAPADAEWTAALLPGWTRCEPDELSRENLETFAIAAVPNDDGPLGPASGAVWDTPDFDSLAARAYRRGVLEIAALADAHLFVLSKEKYSDLSVWSMFDLLRPLHRPLLICLNKITPDAEETIPRSLRQRLLESGVEHGVPIIVLPYDPGIEQVARDAAPSGVADLREKLRAWLSEPDLRRHSAGVCALLKRHWSRWVEPIEAEHAAIREWNALIDGAVADALACYRRDYLEHPRRFDTFRRAIVELLELLEVPVLAGALARMRRLLTWPARRLYETRARWSLKSRKGPVRGGGSEQTVLYDAAERIVTQLARDAARRARPGQSAAPAVWDALGRRLEHQEAELHAEFARAVARQREAMTPEIRAAARRLYGALQEHPALLNTLRAARVTADAAAVAIAVKTVGVGAQALLFAPPLLSLASMLTEGAVGSYMKSVANDLKQRQFAAVQQDLFGNCIAPRLRALAGGLEDQRLFGVSPHELDGATEALRRWEQDQNV